MTTREIVQRVRLLVNDAATPYRWNQEFLKEALRDGVRHLHSVRPSTRYVNGLLVDEVVVPEDAEKEFAIDARLRESLVFYVAGKCYQSDSPDTANAQLAESYLAKADALMRI